MGNNIYKVTAIVCAFLLIFAPMQAFANGEIDSADEITDIQIEIINSLGIIDGITDGILSGEDLSRKEFLYYTMQLIACDAKGVESSAFTDVKPDDWAAGYIAAAAEMGIVSGDSEGRFHPGGEITYAAAVKILTAALGYNEEAKYSGGYPTGYMTVAGGIGLIKNVSLGANDNLTPAQAITLIYNAMDVPIYTIGKISSGSISYTKDKKNNLLTEYHSIYQSDGILTRNSITSLTDSEGLAKGEVLIGDENYNIGKTEAEGYLGCRVKLYYRYDKKDEIRTILHIRPYRTNIREVTSEEISYYGNHKYKCLSDDGDSYEIDISAETDVIYNGKAETEYTDKMLRPDYGKIVFIDNDNDEVYDVLFISSYTVAVVHSYRKDLNIIYTKYGGNTINLGDFKSYKLLDASGKPAEDTLLREYTVLLFIESDGGKYAEILISNNTVKGTVDTSYEDDYLSYEIGGTAYRLGEFYRSQVGSDTSSVGKSGVFHLDANGFIQAVSAPADDKISYGYIISGGLEKAQDRFGKTPALKILTANGSIATLFLTNKKLTFNGIGNTTAEQAYTALESGGSVAKQVIGYKINSDGDISLIDTAGSYNSIEDSLTLQKTAASGRFKSRQGVISGMAGVTSDAILFCVPSDIGNTEEKNFSAGALSLLANDTEFNAGYAAYSTIEGAPLADILVVYDLTGGVNVERNDTLSVIQKTSVSLNKNGDTVTGITLMKRGKIYKYACESGDVTNNIYSYTQNLGKYELGEGDVIKFSLNSEGEISSIQLHYDRSSNQMMTANPTGGYTASPGFMLMNVYDKYGDMIICCFGQPQDGMNPSANQFYYFKASAFDIIVYDEDLYDKVKAGTINDINDYVHYGGEYSTVYVTTWSGEALSMVVYR